VRVLITGGGGFIGGYLIAGLRERHEIFALVQKRPWGTEERQVCWFEQDLTQPLDEARLPKKVDAIIHLAQSRYYRQFPDHSWDMYQVNIGSTLSLLEYGRKIGIRKFIYASSGGIYGYGYERFIETSAINPANFYLATKYCSELLLGNYNAYFKTVVFRFFFVYGLKQQGMLIPRLIHNIRNGDPIVIFGKEGIRINPIHITDATRVFGPSLETEVTGVFNIAGDEVISIKGLSELIGNFLGKTPKFVYEKSHLQGDLIGDNSRMKTVLGVIPERSLRMGICEMV